MRLSTGLLFAVLATTVTLASGSAHATTTADAGETGGDFSSAWFVSPLPNASFEGAPVAIDAEIGVYQGIDDQISDIELFLDGASIGSQPCPDGCVFTDIELDQGVHQLELVAAPNGSASTVTVYVDEEIPMGTETGGESDGGSGSESGADDLADDVGGLDSGDGDWGVGGRGCNAQGGPLSLWSLLALPMLLLVPGVRRKRG